VAGALGVIGLSGRANESSGSSRQLESFINRVVKIKKKEGRNEI